MNQKYLNELNEPQLQAVLQTEGPVMIVAGAGSGKTRVLTYRIAHLIEKGVDPFNILALTFTNKAAKSMKERIGSLVGSSNAKDIWMGTFHSVFAKILRVEAEKIGYPSNFTIYDVDDSKSLIKTILKEQGLDEKVYKPSLVYNRISAAKNSLISPQSYIGNKQIEDEDRMAAKPQLGLLYSIYSKRCFKAGAMDFDDLLFKTNVLLRDFPEVLYKYQHKFRYILVDEYQDTNFAQYLIVKQLAAAHLNICVVGDDAQSIYAFRGANIQNILNFEKDYPELKTFKLEQNYRSTRVIVNAANHAIANNRKQIKKTVWTDNEEGEKIKVMRAGSDNEEGMIIARNIFDIRQNARASEKDFAVLYRTNAQSRAIEEALRKMNIPYRIYGGMSFYQRKEIKDLMAYFRLAINPNDEESLKRVINYPARGIGDTTLDKLIIAATDHDVSIWTILENMSEFNLDIHGGTKNKIENFVTLINSFRVQVPSSNAYDVGRYISENSGIVRELGVDKSIEGVSRYENIQELLNALKEFSEKPPKEVDQSEGYVGTSNTLGAFMEDVALLTDADKENEDDRDKVSLMTIHAAKGLEFPYVFVAGLEENLFPSQMSLNDRDSLEEERRLFYVALTRAEKRAFFTYAISRYRWGNHISCEPSRFLDEIDEQYLEMPVVPLRRPVLSHNDDLVFTDITKANAAKNVVVPVQRKNMVKVNHASSPSNYDNTHLKDLAVGMEVEHDKFGKGKVVNIEGTFPNNKATVFFPAVGQKQLLLKFAKLTIVK